jgi:ribonuclease-3
MDILNRLLEWIRRGSGQRHEQLPTAIIDYAALERILQYKISHQQYFSEALSHRSYLQVSENELIPSNERLEFLGDAVLSLVVAEFLFRIHADAHEGDLTKIRSRLVNRKALSIYAREMHLGDFVLLSRSTAQMEGKGMDTILADAFEAIIGAIYLDGGYHHAKQFIERHIDLALERGIVKTEDENFKSQLLEYVQAQGLGTPRYLTVHQHGPDHDRTFTVEVVIANVSHGRGVGKNKKDAEQAAAERTLHALQHLRQNNET